MRCLPPRAAKPKSSSKPKKSFETLVAQIRSLSLKEHQTDPPGQLRNGGPRHDNDHQIFRAISILPTLAEIVSTVPPYLPMLGGAHHLEEDRVLDRYLDVLFRLLR